MSYGILERSCHATSTFESWKLPSEREFLGAHHGCSRMKAPLPVAFIRNKGTFIRNKVTFIQDVVAFMVEIHDLRDRW